MKRLLTLLTLLAAVFALPGLALAAGGTFGATLSGASEVPAVTTSATGSAVVTISADESTVTYKVTYSGLSGPVVAGHIHLGAAGANGGVMLPFVVGPSPFSGTLTAADLKPTGDVSTFAGAVAAIKAGGTYVNLHTAANQGGEIRGQLSATSQPNTATVEPVADTTAPWLFLLGVFALATLLAMKRLAGRTR